MALKTAIHFSSLLRSFLSPSKISQARQTHVQVLIHGFLSDVALQTDLLRAYTKCGLLADARRVFDTMNARNMHSWNILIFSYVQSSMYSLALGVFDEFRQMGLRPDHYTLPPLFKACVGDVSGGSMLYGLVMKLGLEGCVVVSSSFLDFCLKHGSVVDARRVFSTMPWKDCVAWNSMISGLGKAGFCREALTCFREMLRAGVEVDSMTNPSVLSACGREGDLIKGKEIHGRISKILLYEADLPVGNSLIDMYAKCGCLDDAEKVFRSMTELNIVTWTTMISGYGIHGKGEDSLVLFEEMIDCRFRPNCVTLTAILASCSHSGLIDEGRRIFNSISSVYGLEPGVEHYACMVDLLGRFGYLEEGLRLTKSMNTSVPASVWGALLAGCIMHRNVEIGEIAARRLFELEPRNSSNYVALCSIYDSLRMWDCVSSVRSRMRELGLVKTPGCSWITISGTIYKFYQGDRSHRRTSLIYKTLDSMIKATSLARDSLEEHCF